MKNKSEANSSLDCKKRWGNVLARSGARGDIGQALVELALITPILILLLVGAAEFGRLAYASIEVSNAARAGVAYGAQSHITASDTAGMTTAATNDWSDLKLFSGVTLNVTPTSFCACSNAPSTAVACSSYIATCSAAPINPIEQVQVNTSATVPTLFHYPGLPTSYTLQGQAIMWVEQ